MLRRVHQDNSSVGHVAEYEDGSKRSTMFLTPFVYQFFIYNSIYTIDWPISLQTEAITPLGGDREPPKQIALECFISQRIEASMLQAAFAKLAAETSSGVDHRHAGPSHQC